MTKRSLPHKEKVMESEGEQHTSPSCHFPAACEVLTDLYILAVQVHVHVHVHANRTELQPWHKKSWKLWLFREEIP